MAMLTYPFQHFYSTVAVLIFLTAILILRACGKRGRKWIPVSTAPFGCLAFLVVFILLTALVTWIFGFFTAGPTLEDIAFAIAWLAAVSGALAVISLLTRHFMRRDKIAAKLYPGESRKLLPVQLRNKGILLFMFCGIISCAIDILMVPFPIPELSPGSPLAPSTHIPLPPGVPLDIRISSRVTSRFFGESDFDLMVRDREGSRHVFPAILINPGGGSAVTIYRLKPENNRNLGILIFTNEMESCLLNMDTMQVKSLSGPASNYPPPTRHDLNGPDMDQRLEVVGLYRGLSCMRGEEHTESTRAKVLKTLKYMHP